MPGPGVYVAVVVGVAAGFAFKYYFYDEYFDPKFKQWTGAFAAYHKELWKRRAKAHASSPSPTSDAGDEPEVPGAASSVELEPLIERELHTLDGSTLRKRRPGPPPSETGIEMMEKPNTSIPFVPLAPSAPPPPHGNPLPASSDASLPIDRLPTLQASGGSSPFPPPAPRSAVTPASTRGSDDDMPAEQVPHPPIVPIAFMHTAASPEGGPAVPTAFRLTPPAHGEDGVRARSVSSLGTSPFTSPSVSRGATPSVDGRSDVSFMEVRAHNVWSLPSSSSLSEMSSAFGGAEDGGSLYRDVASFEGRWWEDESEGAPSDVSSVVDTEVSSVSDSGEMESDGSQGGAGRVASLASDGEWDRISETGQ